MPAWSHEGDPCNEVMSCIMPCDDGLYCKRADGARTRMGFCALKPAGCDGVYATVCSG
jgi:hypothetical protein